jgi:hypothetical protein
MVACNKHGENYAGGGVTVCYTEGAFRSMTFDSSSLRHASRTGIQDGLQNHLRSVQFGGLVPSGIS